MLGKYLSFILGSALFFSYFAFSEDECGEDPSIHRQLLHGEGARMPFIQELKLLSAERTTNAHVSKIVISISNKVYYSLDRANTFVNSRSKINCRQSATAISCDNECVYSQANPNVIYRTNKPLGHLLEISQDGGKTWKSIQPKTNTGRNVGYICIISTSEHYPSRVYIAANEIGSSGIYLSSDYGRTFTRLLVRKAYSRINYIHESRANPNVLFSISNDGVIVSKDTGKNWNSLGITHEITSPIYVDPNRIHIQTWKEANINKEISWDPNIFQIETDKNNPSAIYILSYKGLFRSFDEAKSFRLLPLAKDKFCQIMKIAIDPVDARYLYAAVGSNELYVSSNSGCSWNKVKLPTVAPIKNRALSAGMRNSRVMRMPARKSLGGQPMMHTKRSPNFNPQIEQLLINRETRQMVMVALRQIRELWRVVSRSKRLSGVAKAVPLF